MKKGVELLLVIGTPFPDFIEGAHSSVVQSSHETFLNRRVRSLRIVGGEAEFIPGGAVTIRMPGKQGAPIAFAPHAVFEIRPLPLEAGTTVRNRDLCSECVEFSGVTGGRVVPVGKTAHTCTICGNEWIS